MYTLPLLPLFSLLLSTASALPQVVCFAGICNPVVPYNAPYYEIWAHRYYEQYLQDQENRHKNKLQDHDKNLPREIASAEPVNSTSTTAVKAEEPDEPWAGVYYCEDTAWSGACKHVYSPLGSDPATCTQLDGRVSSIGPDPGYYCILYTNALCASIMSDGSDSLTLSYPGTPDLGNTEKGDFNDRLLSYSCFREE